MIDVVNIREMQFKILKTKILKTKILKTKIGSFKGKCDHFLMIQISHILLVPIFCQHCICVIFGFYFIFRVFFGY